MNNIEILEVSCPLVDGSSLLFYNKSEDNISFNITKVINFVSSLDLSENGKIDVGRNTKQLIIILLSTNDFGVPPNSLYIKFKRNDLVYDISVPYSNETYINVKITKMRG